MIGPYRTFTTRARTAAPLYMLPFDKEGRVQAPRTREHALRALESDAYTDVFFFSHGWNNDWEAATEKYEHFITGFIDSASEADAARRSLLLGVFWPSATLVLPGERAPRIAGAPDAGADAAEVAADRRAVDEVAEQLDPAVVERFYELAQRDELAGEEALEFARLLAPLYATDHGDAGEATETPEAEELVSSWAAGGPRVTTDDDADPFDFGTADDAGDGPAAAGILDRFDPRNAVRAGSVWLMKDRAGTVGSRGVADLLGDVLATSDAQVHLIGHSFGAKVMLSALTARRHPRRPRSMLLLQPAVNHLCFATTVPGTDRVGGYRLALGAVERPIIVTYSRHDAPLTKWFHLALRRQADLGEPKTAAWPNPPNEYAALGGFGPGGAEPLTTRIPIKQPGDSYGLARQPGSILALDGSSAIKDHSDISNAATWWALRELAWDA